jgi:type II secretory pathway pseudopilin PulG
MRKKTRAFTLVEALFALFLMALCAAIVAASTPVASRARVKADYLNKATGIAQKELEAIRGLGYPNITSDQLLANKLIDSTTALSPNTYSFTNTDLPNNDSPAKILPSGTGTVLIEQPAANLRRVTVTVNYKEMYGANRQIVIGTLIANL